MDSIIAVYGTLTGLIIALYGHSNYADYSAVNVNNPRPGNHMFSSSGSLRNRTPRDATFSWTLFSGLHLSSLFISLSIPGALLQLNQINT